MGQHYYSQQQYLKISQLFDWATARHYTLFLTGNETRIHSAESVLPHLVHKGYLKRTRYGHKFVYRVPRLCKGVWDDEVQIEHGLGVTEGLVRFFRSDPTGLIIPSRKYRGKGIIPEWAIQYQRVLAYEFCTEDNARRLTVIKSKLSRYQKLFPDYSVLFVMDVQREKVEELVKRLDPDGMFYFTDYATFKEVSIGEQLTAPIYLWKDLDSYPLRSKNV
jgi:hypothetical protein